MNRLSQHVRANAIAYLALFVALGGTSYAAINLPTGSVGSRQIKNHAITPIKFDPATIGASVRYWAIVAAGGHVIASAPRGARVISWNRTDDTGAVTWKRPLPRNCFPLATGDDGFVRAVLPSQPNVRTSVQFQTFDAAGQPNASERADIVVLCPQP